ncbi:MAG: nucleotidyltransferase domain-containing protein [Clostridia bacterium]|nr:nucleotidyltransferase domain-containing protein [Clostridia bacterium]
MLRQRYRLAPAKRARIVGQIRELLSARPEISFAYLHGSFQDKETFGDIDLAVFLSPLPKGTGIYYELALENALEELVHFPIDVRVLNHAPSPLSTACFEMESACSKKERTKGRPFRNTLCPYTTTSPRFGSVT